MHQVREAVAGESPGLWTCRSSIVRCLSNDLQRVQEYAFMNRDVMMPRLLRATSTVLPWVRGVIAPVMEVNCHHDGTERERTSFIKSL